MRPAAFFDLDGTVLRIDSGTSYMRFQRMRGELSLLQWAKVLWWGLQYRFALLDVEHTLCTRVQVHDGRFTGRIEQVCFGRHKVPIAERWAADQGIDLDASVFYSDSYNDLPMLSRVGTAVVVNPDTRLLRHARGAGWRVEKWE